ncbi:hypothetical protein TSUD_26180 [Trifolium subterraneum]|uniref:Reverse transcriptase domain-containing protein n=1 Tax=Trifolium subterraneum TaxID=3900 RepID=A0A2Z6NGU3_TRISU|nr:hypothetical protein TSUD_26180 [Trifolium subterraneum]
MRVSDRESGGAPRATLGWPRRSSSPAERHTRGGRDQGREPEMGWEDGEWTVVQRRRRTERRQADRGFDGERQHRQHRSRSTSILRHSNRSRSRSVLERSNNHGTRMDLFHQDGGFLQHSNARRHGRSPVKSGRDGQHHVRPWLIRDKAVFDPASTVAARQGCVGFDSLGRNVIRFVKFSNVRDVNKLSKALNAVYFGHYRVRVRVARFDRNVAAEDKSSGMVKAGHKVGIMDLEKKVVNLVEEGKDSVVSAKGGIDITEDVRVGDIMVRIGNPQEPTARKDAQVQEAGVILRKPTVSSGVAKEKDDRILMRNFRTMPDDVQWAQNGLVASVINGEAVPVVQNRITDAGFHDLVIIPMGAEKVFIRSTAGADVLTIVNSAKDFFTLVFSNWMRWGKEAATYRRGAWVRLFLRADSVSADRDRLDFARVLIATPDLEIINREESESETSHTDNDIELIDPVIRRDVDKVDGKLVDELAEDDEPELQENHVDLFSIKQDKPRSAKKGIVEKEVQNDLVSSPSGNSAEVATLKHSNFQGDGRDVSNNGSSLVLEAQGSSSVCKPIDGSKNTDGVGRHEGSSAKSFRSKRTNSCPPGANRSIFSGPWSLEWLNDLNQRDAGVIFTASKKLKKGGHSGARQQKEGKQDLKRTKAGYNLFVREKWNSFQVNGWGGFVLKEKFKMIKAALKEWHTTHTQNLPSRIDSLKVRQSCLDQKGEEDVLSEAELEELHGVTFDIHTLSRLHASVCWQQSRSLWLKEGDANSKYFHSVLASRRRGNAISSIVVDGVPVDGVSSVRQAVVSHFAAHFKTTNVVKPRVDDLLFNSLNQMECSSLIKPFTRDEVKAAVWDCDSYKSPGPDGINFGFTKDFWPKLQGEVMRFIVEFHRNGKLTKGLNSTFIALIPKVDSPQCLNDFQPISLVGCLYKILAKVLANRLRLVIGSVISESQTAFVKDRQILDGILIANELVDEARKSKKELMLFKVDFEKAYDSVDWGYLDAVIGRMSFPNLWRKWIKECVCTATASVLVNGSPTDEFSLERGLRQGDPLSPFLFLLVAEGLNVLMKSMVERNLFSGYSVGEGASISISHLQFADYTLLLGDKSWANVRALRAVLLLFESMSGLKVNFNKSMLVGVNIPESWLGEAASALHCRVGKIPFIYLGLPIGGDPRRLGFWEPVLARLKKRLSGWKSRFLSFGGRLILLKSVLTSLPVYALSFFKAPSDGLARMGGWWGGMGVAEAVERVGGGDVGGDPVTLHAADDLIWHPQVPLKVSILAWRLLRDRLPTKGNLVTRGILSPEAHFCVSGCGAVESAQHLFLSYSTFGQLWPLEALGGVALLCNSYGLLAFGLYGMSEIPDVSVAQQIHYSTCWTRSRIILIGG